MGQAEGRIVERVVDSLDVELDMSAAVIGCAGNALKKQ